MVPFSQLRCFGGQTTAGSFQSTLYELRTTNHIWEKQAIHEIDKYQSNLQHHNKLVFPLRTMHKLIVSKIT